MLVHASALHSYAAVNLNWISSRHVHTLFKTEFTWVSILDIAWGGKSFKVLTLQSSLENLIHHKLHKSWIYWAHFRLNALAQLCLLYLLIFSIFQSFKLPGDWFTVSDEGLYLTFPLSIFLSNSEIKTHLNLFKILNTKY